MSIPKTIFLATTNKGKIREIKDFLDDFDIEVMTGSYPDVEETGLTFEENAILKARACALYSNLPTLSDDSGLCVWGINGKPGIFSNRWMKLSGTYSRAFQKIEEEIKLEKTKNYSASFICSLAYCWPNEKDVSYKIFEGRLDGSIVFPPRGTNNFGYDPIFIPTGHQKTLGEMTNEEKEKISHRSLALRKFSETILTA